MLYYSVPENEIETVETLLEQIFSQAPSLCYQVVAVIEDASVQLCEILKFNSHALHLSRNSYNDSDQSYRDDRNFDIFSNNDWDATDGNDDCNNGEKKKTSKTNENTNNNKSINNDNNNNNNNNNDDTYNRKRNRNQFKIIEPKSYPTHLELNGIPLITIKDVHLLLALSRTITANQRIESEPQIPTILYDCTEIPPKGELLISKALLVGIFTLSCVGEYMNVLDVCDASSDVGNEICNHNVNDNNNGSDNSNDGDNNDIEKNSDNINSNNSDYNDNATDNDRNCNSSDAVPHNLNLHSTVIANIEVSGNIENLRPIVEASSCNQNQNNFIMDITEIDGNERGKVPVQSEKTKMTKQPNSHVSDDAKYSNSSSASESFRRILRNSSEIIQTILSKSASGSRSAKDRESPSSWDFRDYRRSDTLDTSSSTSPSFSSSSSLLYPNLTTFDQHQHEHEHVHEYQIECQSWIQSAKAIELVASCLYMSCCPSLVDQCMILASTTMQSVLTARIICERENVKMRRKSTFPLSSCSPSSGNSKRPVPIINTYHDINVNGNQRKTLHECENKKNEINNSRGSDMTNKKNFPLVISRILETIFEMVSGCQVMVLTSLLKGLLVCGDHVPHEHKGRTKVSSLDNPSSSSFSLSRQKNDSTHNRTSTSNILQDNIVLFAQSVFHHTLSSLCHKHPTVIARMTSTLDTYVPLLSFILIPMLPPTLFPIIRTAGHSPGALSCVLNVCRKLLLHRDLERKTFAVQGLLGMLQ